MIITSLKNPIVKHILALRYRRERERCGLMRVEGYDEISIATSCGAKPAMLLYCVVLVRTPGQMDIIARLRTEDVELVELSERVFESVSYRDNPDGWLATFPLPRVCLHELHLRPNPIVLVAEAVEKPGNLGAMVRTADALGLSAVISSSPHMDWGNPNIVRSSRGALFSIPVANGDNHEIILWLRKYGIKIVAAVPDAPISLDSTDLRGPVAIVVGEEHQGLSQTWIEAADVAVSIPMSGRVNSLNVSIAAALLVYEAIKQRSRS